MFKKIIKFIKYSNVFTLIAIAAFITIASVVAANDDVKKVIGEEIMERSGVDNTVLLSTDLDNFDLAMEITNALEDEENFYVDYQYKTLAIKDNVWREVLQQKQITVSRAALAGGDLGLYLMEELGEIIDYQISYLNEVQDNEKDNGLTFVQETTKYTGLIGLVLDTKTKELPGYEPVVKPPVVEEVSASDDDASHLNPLPRGEGNNNKSHENYDDFAGAPEENNDSVDSLFRQWCLLQEDRYWYDETCNIEPESDKPASDELMENKPIKESTEEESASDEQAEEPVIDEELEEVVEGEMTEEATTKDGSKEEPTPADEDELEVEEEGSEGSERSEE